MFLRSLGWRKRQGDKYSLSYAHALHKADCESFDGMVSRRVMWFTGFVERIFEERLLMRVISAEMASFRAEKD